MTARTRGRPTQSAAAIVSDEELLEAVLRAFGENGFDGTSVRDIARHLNVSHNLIPQRFGSKTRLWYAAIDFGFAKFDMAMVREGETLGDDDLVVLRGLLVRTIEMAAANPSLLQIINQEASQPGPRLDYLFETFIESANRFLATWLDRLVKEGRIVPTSASMLYFLINHGAAGAFVLPDLSQKFEAAHPTQPPISVREQAERAVNVLFDGMSPR